MTKKQLFIIFLAAIAVRLLYDALVIHFGGSFNNGGDSGKYLKRAMWFLEYERFVYMDKGVVYPDSSRMPIYVYFLARILQIAGPSSLWAVSVIQAFIDATTVIGITLIAGQVDRRWMWPAAVLGCLWATMVVYASFVLTDTLFLAFFTWGLFACLAAAGRKNAVSWLCFAGMLFSLAVYTRPLLMFYPIILYPILSYLLRSAGKMTWRRSFLISLIPAVIMVLALIPRVITNYGNYGKAVLTTQSGNHALDVIEHLLRGSGGHDNQERWSNTEDEVERRLTNLTSEERVNPAAIDLVKRQVAKEQLFNIPVTGIVITTAEAATRTLLQSATYIAGQQLQRNPIYFSQIEGASVGERFLRFLKTIPSNGFMWFWSLSQLAVLASILLQLCGALTAMGNAEKRPYVWFFIATAAYFLAINGPFSSPRYGLPMAPSMIILTSAGMIFLYSWYLRRRGLLS